MGLESSSKKRRKDESPSKAAAGGSIAKRRTVDGASSSCNSSGNSSRSMTVNTNTYVGGMMKSRSSSSSSQIDPETFFAEFCDIPYTLRTLLVEESTYITRKGFDSHNASDMNVFHRPARSVHVLPARVTVYQVLQQYQKKRGGSSTATSSGSGASYGKAVVDKQKLRQVRKFVDGLAALFDDALPVCLLYPEERPQYEAIQQDEDLKLKRPCEIYGNTFLLRLMLRLPILLRAEPPQEMNTMGPMIADIISLLQKNRQACFKASYREPRMNELLPSEMKLAAEHASAEATAAAMEDITISTMKNNDDCDKSFMSES